MDSIPGLSGLLSELTTKCGAVSALSVVMAAFFILRSTRIQAAWDASNVEAAKRLDAANVTIVKVMEASTRADAEVAIALEGVKTLLLAFQLRGGNDR
jgi:hypothetical protein